eukprot:gene11142-11295_t
MQWQQQSQQRKKACKRCAAVSLLLLIHIVAADVKELSSAVLGQQPIWVQNRSADIVLDFSKADPHFKHPSLGVVTVRGRPTKVNFHIGYYHGNVAIVRYGNRFILAVRKMHFYKTLRSSLEGYPLSTKKDEEYISWWSSKLGVCSVESLTLQPISCEDYDPRTWKECEWSKGFEGEGPEDPRLIVWPGKGLFMMFGSKPWPKVANSVKPEETACDGPWAFQPWLKQLQPYGPQPDPDDPWGKGIIRLQYLSGEEVKPDELLKEKNWNPFIYKGKLLFSQQFDPHVVIQPYPNGTCVKVFETQSRVFRNLTSKPRGNTQAVLVPSAFSGEARDFYLGVVHAENKRAYQNYFYKMQAHPPFRIYARSKPMPIINGQHPRNPAWTDISFPMSLELIPETNQVMIGYGSGDQWPRVVYASRAGFGQLLVRWSRFSSLLQQHRQATTAVARSNSFSTVNEDDIDFFTTIVGERGVVQDPMALEPMNKDWMGKYVGHSTLALKPSTTDQVSQVLAYCSLRRLAVVPQGGNTGLVGGSVPVFDEIVLSLSSMNKIVSFDEVSGVLVCQAGCILQTLDEHVSERGYIMPLDLGAKGSCEIGGNVSTNAGGLRLLRYGSLHGSVLGVEAVLPDGSVLDLLRQLRKDNTGYDLKQLFIGSEGSLGVVTAVAIQCAPKPASVQLAFFQCPSFQAVQHVLLSAKQQLGEILSAVEFLDTESLQMVTTHLPGVSNPLQTGSAAGQQQQQDASEGQQQHPFYMLVETQGSNEMHDREKLEAFLEGVMSDGSVVDGALAESQAQAAAIWRVREGITESLVRRGAVYKYDLSMPTACMYELVELVRQRTAHLPDVKVVGYGHVGDGNLHLNISAPGGYCSELEQLLEPFVYEWTAAQNGSISAEHGIGLMKVGSLQYSKSREVVDVMQRIKLLLDPHRILNPYKVLPGMEHLGQVEYLS